LSRIRRVPGQGWIALLGGGEFSFGETEECDRAWLAKTAEGPIGFVPAASDSADYGKHIAVYFGEVFDRDVEVIPIYRARDARRAKNADRLDAVAAIYLGGGVTDHLLEAMSGSPAAAGLRRRLETGGTIVAIAAAAQALGDWSRSIFGGKVVAGLGLLPGGLIETNFEPDHDRRLRQAMKSPGVEWGLGLPAESAALLGPAGQVEIVGTVFLLSGAEEDFQVLGEARKAV
jgi:cyanophycinase-like exopeptidase